MDYLVQPWDHQKDAIERARHLDYFALFFEQGTGKTSALINILREKYLDETKPFRTLILCPPIVIDNWVREFKKYSRVPHEKLIPIVGTKFARLITTDAGLDAIYITNYQSLLMDKLYQRLLNFGFRAVVLDESHKIKSYNSKTTKRVQQIGELAQYRYCLTGTPILNTAFDIWPQVSFLDRGESLGKSFFSFRAKYFHDFNAYMPRQKYFPNWKIKPDSTVAINQIIKPFSSRILKKDCLNLPPLIRQRIDCEMTPEQKRVYSELEKEFVATMGNGVVVTDLELTKGLRLQQIVSGYCPNTQGVIHAFEANSRLEVTGELLQELSTDHKILVWACFRENFRRLELLCTSLGIKFVSVFGGINPADARSRCEDFESDSTTRVLIGHPKSCGIGVNLTAADYAIFYSRSFDLGDDLQAEARNYRGGSEKHGSIVRIDLVTPNTIDEIILEALESKQLLADSIIGKDPNGSEILFKQIKQKREKSCTQQQSDRMQ